MIRTRLIKREEPEGSGIDRLADLYWCQQFRKGNEMDDGERKATYRDQAVILQDGRLAVTETLGDLLALFAIQHDAAEIWVHGMALVEAQTILRDHVELAAEDGECFAVDAWWGRSVDFHHGLLCLDIPVSVTRSVYIRSGLVDLGMDGEGCGVDGLVADDDFAVFVDEDKVADADEGEVLGKGIEPCRFSLVRNRSIGFNQRQIPVQK